MTTGKAFRKLPYLLGVSHYYYMNICFYYFILR
jgi:hypothetical protein